MVQCILGLPCAGLWLAHIDSDFVLNEYGMPKNIQMELLKLKLIQKKKLLCIK